MTDLSPETVERMDTSTLGPICVSTSDEFKPGYVVWHSSEEDGGPDVGLTIGLGNGKLLWIGERCDREGGGQGIMIYSRTEMVANASLADRDEVMELMQHHLALALRTLATSTTASDGRGA